MTKLPKYEKGTILLARECDNTWDVYTFKPTLKPKLMDFITP